MWSNDTTDHSGTAIGAPKMERLIMTIFLLALSMQLALAAMLPPVTLENWEKHPAIKEVREIQRAINREVKNKKYRTKSRRFKIESPRCRTSYPMVSEAVYYNAQNRVALYHVIQMGSHEEMYSIDRYYDNNGILRFFFLDRITSKVRIYFDRNGKQIWAVDQNGDEYSESQGWETEPETASAVLKAFREQQSCPEL
jgi:hypothetical protein